MKKLTFLAVLCACAMACTLIDTEKAGMWSRTVEPRLTGATWQPCQTVPLLKDRVVRQARCGTPPSREARCTLPIVTRIDAAEALAKHPACLDQALEVLAGLSAIDRGVLSDLAAAYYMRAQRDDYASDLLRAFDAASRAVDARPSDPAAHYNLALIEESLGLTEEAVASWQAASDDNDAKWKADAETRRATLQRENAEDWTVQWARIREALPGAIKSGDEGALARLIQDFPRDVLKLYDPKTDPKGILARVLSKRLVGDRYPLDMAGGRRPQSLIDEYRGAKDADELATVEREARLRQYWALLGTIQAKRAYLLFTNSRLLESLQEFEAAIRLSEQLNDAESLAGAYRNVAGIYRTMGQNELSWRAALTGLRYRRLAHSVTADHVAFGEAAATAQALGYSSVALAYQSRILPALEKANLPMQQSIALRHRAMIELATGDIRAAARDRDAAVALNSSNPIQDADTARLVEAGMLELDGRSLSRYPESAAAKFTAALEQLHEGEQRTFCASLLVQRAEAERKGRDDARAQADLRLALGELEKEQAAQLNARKPGEAEAIWSSYFGRFDDVYEQVIRQFIDDGHEDQAYFYAESKRAYEPLDLIMRRTFAPERFRALAKNGHAIARADLQQELPPGTFILQFCATADRLYTWVISRDEVRFVSQDVGRNAIARWTETLQRAGRTSNAPAFDDGLIAPSDQLFTKPLRAMATMAGGAHPARVVIIPDGPMHGLPFGAMLTPTGRYLFQLAPLETAASATMYVFALLRDAALPSPAAPTALLIGDPAFDPQSTLAYGLERLPKAGEEVRAIRGEYQDAKVLIGPEATVEQFLALANGRTVIHFAGHSIVNAQDPSRSLLLFAASGDKPGVIEARQLVAGPSLERTHLVVLAACSSAGGLPVGPEGVAPLVRPLITAGVPGVVGSLWDVNDATAKALFVSFHRHYRQGRDAAAALRAAQAELLGNHNPGLRSAIAWAPFQVIGHASSPFEATKPTTEEDLELHRTNSLQRDARIHPQ